MGGIGAPELIIVLAALLLLFGAPRLPKLAKAIGQASKEFRIGASEGHKDEDGPKGEDRPKELGRDETQKPASPSAS